MKNGLQPKARAGARSDRSEAFGYKGTYTAGRAYSAWRRRFAGAVLLVCCSKQLIAQAATAPSLPLVTFSNVGTITNAATSKEPWVTIGAVHLDRNGGLFVSFPEEQTIRHFSREGKFLGSVGRKGRGPGEFERLAGIGWLGDTLWAADQNGQRLHLFSPSGTYLRTQIAVATQHDGYGVYATAMLQEWARGAASQRGRHCPRGPGRRVLGAGGS